ncbi:EF-P beta-lysylation protein EpmB [Halochromatium glycolicum]|uniref:L-lysine 2,3-aminomutase n=2 Tax=Halochromatium glycolicum TaxID=85075 RepID=A0AAJ0XAR9_9GAMM|nr:EF-P beta-lysylation protein EpmB [Halochromatium glycolicum]
MAGLEAAAEHWRRELRDAFTDTRALLDYLAITPEQISAGLLAPRDQAQQGPQGFPLLVPRRFASLMQRGDPHDPLLRQVLPSAAEAQPKEGFVTDPVGDVAARRATGLLQKYARRALLIATGACAVHCRYCFRRHFAYRDGSAQRDRFAGALAALATTPEINEVILSGGDPLMLDDRVLAELINALEQQPGLKRLRLHTRIPSILPSRITRALCDRLAASRLDLIAVVHINHPAEIDMDARRALAALREVPAMLLNQSVLLRGVNDDGDTLAALSEALFDAGVLPYYLHLLDPVSGAAHFDVPAPEARALMSALRGRLPGYLVPRLVREDPGAAAKTVVL